MAEILPRRVGRVQVAGSGARPVMVDTPAGTARAHVEGGSDPRGLAVLGHSAGGGVEAPDLVAVTAALVKAGWAVARVEQPYRVAGRRAPAPAAQLDAAWTAVVAVLLASYDTPLVVGGRSSGARVACRTAEVVDAAAVVCLAFPLRPPRRPEKTRAGELEAVQVPVLVVQGERDPFGGPADLPPGPTVVAVADDHSLRRSAVTAGDAVATWVAQVVQ